MHGRNSKMPDIISKAVLILGLMAVVMMSFANTKQHRASNQDGARRASEATDRFIARFRETLDFGAAFDEVAAPNFLQGLRNTRFFENFGVNENLVRNSDAATLRRLYKAIMNVHYLGAVYNSSIGAQAECGSEQEVVLPDEVRAAYAESRLFRSLSAGNNEDAPVINTRQDLEEYIALQNRVAVLLRRHLPSNVFNSPAYRRSVAALGQVRQSGVTVRNGYEDFGIPQSSPVYVVQRDLFTVYLIEDQNEIKVLTFGIGN
jgi:hypothetical protein